MDLFKDLLPSLNKKTEYLGNGLDKSYNQFIVNRAMAMTPSSLPYARILNKTGYDDRWHYDFLYHMMPAENRFGKWAKPIQQEDLQLVKDYFEYGTTKALQALEVLSPEDLQSIREKMDTGGIG